MSARSANLRAKPALASMPPRKIFRKADAQRLILVQSEPTVYPLDSTEVVFLSFQV